MKRSVAVLLGAILLGAAGVAVHHASAANEAETRAANDEVSHVRKELDAQRTMVRNLSLRLEACRLQATTLANAPTDDRVPDGASASARLTLEEVLAEVPLEQQEEAVKHLEKKSTAMRMQRVVTKLAEEPKDANWESEVMRTMSDASQALDTKTFPTTRVRSVDCGSTVCRIEIDQDSADEHESLLGKLHTGLRMFGVRRGGNGDPPGEQRGWTVFIARQGHELPQVELEELVKDGLDSQGS